MTSKQVFFVVTTLCVFFGFAFGSLRRVITVRPTQSNDSVRREYFQIKENDVVEIEDNELEIKEVLVASGRFTKQTELAVALYAVQAGSIEPLSGVLVFKKGSSIWGDRLRITCALISQNTSKGRLFLVGTSGHSDGMREDRAWPVSIEVRHSEAFGGSFSHGRHIVYVEGDEKINAHPGMSLDEFAANNAGNYLVVTMRVRNGF